MFQLSDPAPAVMLLTITNIYHIWLLGAYSKYSRNYWTWKEEHHLEKNKRTSNLCPSTVLQTSAIWVTPTHHLLTICYMLDMLLKLVKALPIKPQLSNMCYLTRQITRGSWIQMSLILRLTFRLKCIVKEAMCYVRKEDRKILVHILPLHLLLWAPSLR